MNLALLIGASLLLQAGVESPAGPGWTGEYAGLKVLNNFVTELLSTPLKGPAGQTFLNPRDGWVFLAVSGVDRAPRAVLDGAADPLVWRRNPETGAFEAMQRLAKGKHVVGTEVGDGAHLTVRTMPEIAFCYYPSGRHITAYEPYDWPYVGRYVLPHVNTLIARNDVPQDEFEQWLREGRQWIANASLPGLSSKEAPSADGVYSVWAKNAGAAAPGFGGLIVDEFLGASEGHYRAWGDAVRRLHETPGFRNRTFYAWCGDLHRNEPSLAFSRLLTELGHRFSWERYLREVPTPEDASKLIERSLKSPFLEWREAMPGVERNVVMCLGYLSAPPETLNANPGVDYHVFMDMQFQYLATDPAFQGLYGIMEYMAAYADEESIRWAHKLCRHYCIEGRRTRFTDAPYILPHLMNPDFENGLDGWRVKPAEDGSVDGKQMKGFSSLEGRYPRTRRGDEFCWMRRSAAGPNIIRQTIRALEPGRAYSLKLISADLKQLDVEKMLTLDIDVGGAERLSSYEFQFPYPSCYSHEVDPYNRENPAHLNFHRVVFRPAAATVELTISDWATPTEPGGPLGQETVFNFAEVQPFLEP